eukprot:CAMPEP_0197079758 /NCGR_PEP_ID=MMETSP1384-20130603/213787_1 /TAXON_ID=29189 /ORGANISM="Ammonia sp." /LENGTH=357 /DNA_ID=CAMNT_0042518637 /DNA_START=40 /DNA_END=1113 /DNA_ORIENTATION=+
MAEDKETVAQENAVVLTGKYDITCMCGDTSLTIQHNRCTGDSLYYCRQCTSEKDASNAYCEECGSFFHRKNKKGHTFDVESDQVISINDMLESKEDDEKASFGMKLVRVLIGVERWNQVAPYLENTAMGGATSIGALVLYSELTTHFASKVVAEASSKAVQAFATKNVLKTGAIGMVVVTIAELTMNAYRWHSGEISGKEWFRLAGKAIARNVAACGGICAGAKLGAAAGTAFCPGVGTAVGLIAGVVFGYLAGQAAALLYEKYFPDDEEKAKRESLEEALKYFHFQKADIKNTQKFNERELRKRFKAFALSAHPDKNEGDHTEWHILSTHYGILRGLCQSKAADKTLVQQVLAIAN